MTEIKKFSGYLSNKKELSSELGITGTDEEYIVSAYGKWGMDFTSHLQGMFGFILEEPDGRKILVRDRFGNESVYYYLSPEGDLVYGLTINEILQSGCYEKKLNEQALELYLTYSYLPGKQTFFEGITKVMPGHVVIFDKGKISITRYWKPEYRGDAGVDIDTYAAKINEILKEAVEDWKLPGEKYGNFLSGGVDSAYLAALTKPKYTFSTAYDNQEFDESGLAAVTAKILGAEHIRVRITPEEYFDVIPEAMKAMEQPLADASTIAFYLACKGARKYVDICYSGEGADELFCGYHAYTRRLVNLDDPEYPSAPVENYYIGNTKVMTEKEKQEILLHYKGELTPLELANSLYEFDEDTDDITKMWLCDLQVWFEGDIMLNAEKMSKANHLAARTPFLDSRLYEIASRIPSEYKVSREETKIVFRKAAAHELPEEIAFRKKLGFAVPARVWMMEEPYLSRIRERLESAQAARFFDVAKLRTMLCPEYLDQPDHWRKVWNIYIFLVWCEQYGF